MPIRTQKQVMAGLDLMAGRAMGRSLKTYKREVVDPLVAAIGKAKSLKGLQKQLGASLLRKMDTSAFETQLADSLTQADMIGRVSATPRAGVEGRKETK
jgi:phage gp29-like protein